VGCRASSSRCVRHPRGRIGGPPRVQPSPQFGCGRSVLFALLVLRKLLAAATARRPQLDYEPRLDVTTVRLRAAAVDEDVAEVVGGLLHREDLSLGVDAGQLTVNGEHIVSERVRIRHLRKRGVAKP
jgi:hypothetical protein